MEPSIWKKAHVNNLVCTLLVTGLQMQAKPEIEELMAWCWPWKGFFVNCSSGAQQLFKSVFKLGL
jgi:hypothetical protein